LRSIGAEQTIPPRQVETEIAIGFKRHDGVMISGITPGGAADQVGMQAGDLILAIDGHYIYTVDEMNEEIHRHPPGSRVKVRYRHYTATYENYLIMGRAPTKDSAH